MATTDRRCARAEHCGNAAPDENTGQIQADCTADGLPYCRRCTATISRALAAMPGRYVWGADSREGQEP